MYMSISKAFSVFRVHTIILGVNNPLQRVNGNAGRQTGSEIGPFGSKEIKQENNIPDKVLLTLFMNSSHSCI